ncbi:MAG: hypothetical protein M3Q86_10425 [Verrucomicrobiota bacterium]|nr:hypothetical protein [Verrucomicrobiota bacterium]
MLAREHPFAVGPVVGLEAQVCHFSTTKGTKAPAMCESLLTPGLSERRGGFAWNGFVRRGH